MKNAILTSALAVILGQAGCASRKVGRRRFIASPWSQRTTKAINYQYRNGPTMIDFVGTAAAAERAWRSERRIRKRDAPRLTRRSRILPEPNRFGREYLTYVLWALTPEGRPRNMGEIVPGSFR